MSSSISISERDLRTLLAVIDDGRRDAPGPGVPWALLDGLRGLIRCEEVALVELDLSRRSCLVHQGAFDDGERDVEVDQDASCDPRMQVFFQYHRDFIGCGDPELTDELRRVIHWGELYTPTELRNEPLYAEYFRPDGIKHGMYVGLPTLPGRTRRVLFRRYSGRDFNGRDRLILQLLRPHLYAVYQDAELRRRGVPRLTRRERDVLRLAAQGYSNVDIARLLFVSLSTVRKHMEHIFDRTGVRTRSAAVARMIPRLTIPDSGPRFDR